MVVVWLSLWCRCGVVVVSLWCRCGVVVVSLWCRCGAVVEMAPKRHRICVCVS